MVKTRCFPLAGSWGMVARPPAFHLGGRRRDAYASRCVAMTLGTPQPTLPITVVRAHNHVAGRFVIHPDTALMAYHRRSRCVARVLLPGETYSRPRAPRGLDVARPVLQAHDLLGANVH